MNFLLYKAIKTTFQNATIPAIYVDMNNGEIYLDDNKIGEIQKKGQLVAVTKTEIRRAMRNSFSAFVKALTFI